ncbi:porin [Agarivorans sp. MS3-6]
MNKTILAIAIPALFAAGATNAQEIYNDGENAFSIGGRLNLMVESANEDGERDARAEDNASRINLNFSRELTNGFAARATMEYGLDNPNGDSSNPFFNRLGFLALDHDDYGSLSFGKQWSTYYSVVGNTDVFWVYGGTSMGIYDGATGINSDGELTGGHGVAGTGRANDALQYNGSFGGVNLSGQYQFADQSNGRKDSYSGAISYDFDFGLNVGTTYHQMNRTAEAMSDVKRSSGGNSGDAKLAALAATYNQGPIYAAVTYGEFKDHVSFDGETVSEKAIGHEGVVAYTLDMGLQLYTGWNVQDDKAANSLGELKEGYVGAMYDWNNILLYTEYRNSKEKDVVGVKTDDNRLAAGVRYNF